MNTTVFPLRVYRPQISTTEIQGSIKANDVRGEPRFPLHEAASLTVLPPGKAETIDVILRDISRSGLGLKAQVALATGIAVLLRWERVVVIGEVRHCRQEPEGYVMGLSVIETIRDLGDEPHVGSDVLHQYAAGLGYRVPQAKHQFATAHLRGCFLCRLRLAEAKLATSPSA